MSFNLLDFLGLTVVKEILQDVVAIAFIVADKYFWRIFARVLLAGCVVAMCCIVVYVGPTFRYMPLALQLGIAGCVALIALMLGFYLGYKVAKERRSTHGVLLRDGLHPYRGPHTPEDEHRDQPTDEQ